ncbi:hypothetical protein HID58_071004, partial [Brassica napus]
EAKMEMTVNELTAERFKGLEKQEGKWVEIFRVEVGRALLGFKATNSPYTLVRIIDPLNNRHYMEFKNILDIPHISNMNRNYLIYIMGVVFDTETHFDDSAMPKMVSYIRDNIESQIKCVATAGHAYAFQDGFESMRDRVHVIVVLKMWRVWSSIHTCIFGHLELWLKTNGGLSDFRFNPHLEEVEEFRQSLNNSDPYVRRHGAGGLCKVLYYVLMLLKLISMFVVCEC